MRAHRHALVVVLLGLTLSGCTSDSTDTPAPSAGTPPRSAPAVPTGLGATAADAQVTLSWSASSGASSYKVKRSTTSGGPYSTVQSGISATTFTNTGLTNGTTYFYVVSAVNSTGESVNSAQASATPNDTTSAGCPPFPAFPDENCTGWEHTGVTLQNYTGPMTITTAGTIIDGKKITGDLCIAASDVVVTRSQIDGTVTTAVTGQFGWCLSDSLPTNILLQDVEIVGLGTPTTRDDVTAATFAVSGSHFTCRRCKVHRWGSGFYVKQNVRIEDSYVFDTIGYLEPEGPPCRSPYVGPDCIAHRSCVGGNGAINAQYLHNHLRCNNLNGVPGVSGALVIYSQPSNFLPARDVLARNNLLSAEEASYCAYAGTGEDGTASNVKLIENRFTRTYQPRCGLNGPYVLGPTGVTACGNKYTDEVAIDGNCAP